MERSNLLKNILEWEKKKSNIMCCLAFDLNQKLRYFENINCKITGA